MIDAQVHPRTCRFAHRRPLKQLDEPLFRNGHALILGTVLTSVLGFVFWIIAAHIYSPAIVGKDNATISALSFLGGFAQLNLASVLLRFIPVAGMKRRRFLIVAYGTCTVVAIVFAIAFLIVVPRLIPTLAFIARGWGIRLWWILSTIIWSVFILEDGAMTGLRRASWVPVENAGFSLLKIGLIVPLAVVFPTTGIFFAWTFATLLTVIPTNFFIFARAIPAEQGRAPAGDVVIDHLVRYAPYDFLAQLTWLAATSLLPLLIIHHLGAAANAYFSFDWLITYVLFLVSINLGSSLIVETAADTSQLGKQTRRVVAHAAQLLVPAVTVVVLGAPLILRLFGPAYAREGATTLRLLALSALPYAIVAIAVSALRAQRKTRYIFLIDATICALVMLLSAILLPRLGIDGAAIAWLAALSTVAGVLAATSRRWTSGATSIFSGTGAPGPRPPEVAGRARLAARVGATRPRKSHGRGGHLWRRLLPELSETMAREHGPAHDLVCHELPPELPDTTVALVTDRDGAPLAVAKIPTSARSRADLEHHCDAVGRLVDDERLAHLRGLLPTSRFYDQGALPIAIESAIPGLSAEQLLIRSPSLAPGLVRLSLETIGRLHGATAFQARLDDPHFDLIVGRPLDLLRVHNPPSNRSAATYREAVERLEGLLRSGFGGHRTVLSYVHGAFGPGNVVVDATGSQVTGILDWGRSASAGVPVTDLLSFVLAARCLGTEKQFGHVVRDAYNKADGQPDQLTRYIDPAVHWSGFDHSDLVLLCWLQHVAGNLERSDHFSKDRRWWATTVDPVVDALVT